MAPTFGLIYGALSKMAGAEVISVANNPDPLTALRKCTYVLLLVMLGVTLLAWGARFFVPGDLGMKCPKCQHEPL